MKVCLVSLGVIWIVGCAQQRVADSLNQAGLVEGREYAAEMAAQSPFDTVEMRWSEAVEQMERRNQKFITARQLHDQMAGENPEVGEITNEVRRAMTTSLGGALNPGAFIESISNPATQLPKQLATLSGIKDISHNVGQSAWKGASSTVDAEMTMRSERVKLHRLLLTGELLDQEMERLEKSMPSAENANPELIAATREWRNELSAAREKWLVEVRDFFDAEYHDVRFIRDGTGLPSYRDVEQPDLADWERWCQLSRSKELVEMLAKSHAENKSAMPGATLVTSRLGSLVNRDDDGPEMSPAIRDSGAVRREVRTLVQSWRKMKNAQEQAARLEAAAADSPEFAKAADVNNRRKIHQLRAAEIENAAVVWMMDEKCWQ